MPEFYGVDYILWFIGIGVYILYAFKLSPRAKRYHISFFVCAALIYLWITGRISQFGEWISSHSVEIGRFVFGLILLISLIVVISLIKKYWQAILKSAIVGYIVGKVKIILTYIWLFIQTPLGFCFSFTFGLSLAVIKINPELARLIMLKMPIYILYGVISWAVATILVTIYNRINPKLYHSMAYYNTDARAWSYLGGLKNKGPAKIVWKWYSPDGNQYEEISYDIDQDTVSCWSSIQIAGKGAANLIGNWQIDIFLKNKKIQTEYFSLLKEK